MPLPSSNPSLLARLRRRRCAASSRPSALAIERGRRPFPARSAPRRRVTSTSQVRRPLREMHAVLPRCRVVRTALEPVQADERGPPSGDSRSSTRSLRYGAHAPRTPSLPRRPSLPRQPRRRRPCCSGKRERHAERNCNPFPMVNVLAGTRLSVSETRVPRRAPWLPWPERSVASISRTTRHFRMPSAVGAHRAWHAIVDSNSSRASAMRRDSPCSRSRRARRAAMLRHRLLTQRGHAARAPTAGPRAWPRNRVPKRGGLAFGDVASRSDRDGHRHERGSCAAGTSWACLSFSNRCVRARRHVDDDQASAFSARM